MLDAEIKINQFLMQYCRMMTAEIADERMADQPLPGVNHPAWILGHLAFSSDLIPKRLGAATVLPADWTTMFGPGSKLAAERSAYPSKDELTRALDEGFERARQCAATATPEQLAQPTTNPHMKDALPTMREGIAFLLTAHLAGHLGQLSAWRRMIGLPPLF